MNLTKLHIRHFQSLYDVELTLKPLTILIGPNASGKSNLFKALRFMYDAVAGDRLDWQAYDGQLNELRWYEMMRVKPYLRQPLPANLRPGSKDFAWAKR